MEADSALTLLLGTTVSIAALHTVIGVDHSLPFVVLGKARGWSLRRVLAVTALCGLGHVLSSVVLGAMGIGLGVAAERLDWIERMRGGLAAWLLIGFGTLYALRGLWRRYRSQVHEHSHVHEGGVVHKHPHDHRMPAHRHPHPAPGARSTTVWALFIIFVFGPCEPMIPLLMAPAAMHHFSWVVLVGLVFSVVTISAMVTVVAVAYLGLSRLHFDALERNADVLAGLAIVASGVAIQALGI